MSTLTRLAAEAVEQADERLLRAAQGDCSPDPREARFPPLRAPQAGLVSPCVPFELAWEVYLAERKPASGSRGGGLRQGPTERAGRPGAP